MIIDPSHRKWIFVTILLLAISTGIYVPYHVGSLNGPTGNTWTGLAYGIVGSALMLFVGFIGARRKVPTWRLGSAETWLKGHIWLGLLSYPLIYFHAGFQFGGALTVALMVIFTIVILSGIFGLTVQHFVPRLMTTQVPMETIYEQVDQIVAQLIAEAKDACTKVCGPLTAEDAAKAAEEAKTRKPKKGEKPFEPAEGSPRLKEFYLRVVEPFLLGKDRTKLATSARRSALFEQLRIVLPPPLHDTVTHLEEICEERRQLAVQVRLHHWLHGWLFVHLPLSMALLVLSVAHAIMALYY